MLNTIFLTFSLLSFIVGNQPPASSSDLDFLAQKSMSLENRYADEWVNGVFKDNILLNLAYIRGVVKNANSIEWEQIKKPFKYEMKLKPGEVFAYHDDFLPEFQGKVTRTTNAHFNYADGFKSDGFLMGDGVCHLASLINWAAREAGLDVLSPVFHDFAVIPDIPREYGVSIYSNPMSPGSNSRQNLYIRNNLKNDVVFVFDYNGKDLKISVLEDTPDSN